MKKILIICSLFLMSFSVAQQQDKTSFWKNVQFGGGINLAFGNDITNLGISPSAIYNFNDQFSAGLGLSYLYVDDKRFDESLNVYGASIISFYNPTDELQLSLELEENFIDQSGFDSRNVTALYVGLGYLVGKNVAIGMRYDVLYDDDDSIYGSAFSPIARIYF